MTIGIWNPFHSLLHGEYATFQELEDFYNVNMSIVCVLCAGQSSYSIEVCML